MVVRVLWYLVRSVVTWGVLAVRGRRAPGAALFVEAAYQACLQRRPDPAGASAHLAALHTKPWGFLGVVHAIVSSAEFAGRGAAPVAASPAPWVSAGHFYSPLPSLDEVRAREARVFAVPDEIPGVELSVDRQLALWEKLRGFYATQPFGFERTARCRYTFDNPNFAPADAVTLHSLLRHLRPQRIVEVGSGYSSCVMLDTNEQFLDGAARCTFIEPYPDLLRSLLRPGDADRVTIIPRAVQDVGLDVFAGLAERDILFIDSSHVSKVGSDVNWLLFEVLPILKPGVWVHFHDVAFPFEYPRSWVFEGRAWNEAYLVRAFLMYNTAFAVEYSTSFLAHVRRDRLKQETPLLLEEGMSLWVQRRAGPPGGVSVVPRE
jgi:predicted O-methyltransferase YrrM